MTSTALARQMPGIMAFYHQDGFVAAWKQATKFAGPGGRIATMIDVVAMRLASTPGELPWETYFTTLTAEYYGISRSGRRILIVAHGIGPMATLEGIQKAYSWQYKDKTRSRRGGRITQEEFWNLEDGKYGEVDVIDLEIYCRRYQYPFMETLRVTAALTDTVLEARLGPQAQEYIVAQGLASRRWHREQMGLDPENKYNLPNHDQFLDRRRSQHLRDGAENSDPYIVQVRDESNLCYHFGMGEKQFRDIEKGYAFAHLISTGALVHMGHEGNESLINDVGCHAWNDGVRLVAIKEGGSVRSGLHKGPDAHRLLRKHWKELLQPVEKPEPIGFCALTQIGEQWFTQYPKIGERMDTWEPEYVVSSIEEIGQPSLFRTTSSAAYVFFKFGTNEVQTIAPPNANAYYFVGEPVLDPQDREYTICPVQFYRIEVDTSKRLRRSEDLARDFDALMKLIERDVVSV